ncbi:hypothetical protein GNI_148080 [Gregarina niphandrodes]|uniref:Transmembrane protein n=1 Tax=Gregarina niphandrodes TaxID=110365 RepID=A0A023B0I7_GRENI|nr:hypothetical protein GNI_148080 [Gregarina niphandrodes]EZG44365.1 hypothetical protein GNI_148080 [Gregarina niphandrodes]|eukprot:XP_011132680.1 hypothetical protein GNI_148080 [Gregarina niphandrodes]
MSRTLLLGGIALALPQVIYKVSQTHGYDAMTFSIRPVELLAVGVEISTNSAFYLGDGHLKTTLTSNGGDSATFKFSIENDSTAEPVSENCSLVDSGSAVCELTSVPLVVGTENVISFTKSDGPDVGYVTWEGLFGTTSVGKIRMKAGLLSKGDLSSYTSVSSEYSPTKGYSPATRPCLPRTHFYVQAPLMRQRDEQTTATAEAGTPIGTGLGVDRCSVKSLAPNAQVTVGHDTAEFFYGFLTN